MSVPYIGITDFTSSEQVRRMRYVFNRRSWYKPKRLHVGVMMSRKTLNEIETKWSKVFPPKESIADIFSEVGVMNCLHYADYEGVDVANNLLKAIRFGGNGMDALQLDMVWPDPLQVADAVRASGKSLEVILQIGTNALDEISHDPRALALRLRAYHGCITHVLLDKSMGRGLGMDAQGLLPFVWEIRGVFPKLGVAVAGGLGPYTMHLLEPLLRQASDISIDAQSKLRPSGSALDPIDWDMAAQYIREASNIM